jgi:hypothetical protein
VNRAEKLQFLQTDCKYLALAEFWLNLQRKELWASACRRVEVTLQCGGKCVETAVPRLEPVLSAWGDLLSAGSGVWTKYFRGPVYPPRKQNNHHGNIQSGRLEALHRQFLWQHSGCCHVDCDDALFHLGLYHFAE